MASNGQWAESVIKVMHLKLDELNRQVAAVQAAITSVEQGFDTPSLVLPTMFREMQEAKEAKEAKEAAEVKEAAAEVKDTNLLRLPNVEDVASPSIR